jgi:glycosyltransferase involved in cell wall biosynthesis
MQPEKVAYVHTGVWPSNSPSFTFVTYNALSLAKQFKQVILYIKKGSSNSSDNILRYQFGQELPQNLKIIALPLIFKKINFLYYFFVLLSLLYVKPSVIITRHVGFLPFLIILKKICGVPVFFEAHDFFTDLSLRDDKINRTKKKNHFLEKKYLNSLTGFICLQKTQATLYGKYYPDLPIHVLRTGINRINKTEFEQAYFLCYIGSIDQHKGIMTIFKAASLSRTKPDIMIIGGKTEKEIRHIQEISSKYYYRDKTVITGWLTKPDLDKYLNQVRIGMVSLEETFFNHYITSPLKIFDYYSFGIPVLATDLPTTRELIDNGMTGFLFPAGDTEACANFIDDLYADKVLYERMRDNVYKKAESLLWENRAKKFKQILEILA